MQCRYYTKPNSFLDFYIHACLRLVRNKHQLNRLDASTHLLTAMHSLIELPLITNVGLLSPLIMADIVSRNFGRCLRAYMARFATPIRAANLCSSFRGSCYDGVKMDDLLNRSVVDKLLETRGAVINRYA